MFVELEGGCRVVGLKEGAPLVDGDLRIWPHFDGPLSLRILELHGQTTLHDEEHDEVLYVLDGEQRDTGILIPAGASMTLSGEMTLVSSWTERRRPDGWPGGVSPPQARTPASQPAGTPALQQIVSARLQDQPIQKTGDRWYRELIQGEMTQFVGSIPPGRAPDHFHLYEEAMCVLEGSGIMWTGSKSAPIVRGSCIFLPRRQVHCVENTGSRELRLLGVFYPAGSPAVRYPA